ncbi:hypothetical protein F4780DRAFT_427390 [Xylariomycetidae sp. FL0641]|nr:hypothetical protein F4780DRAFT_427390 [Xylariomycetidae sp. FL0641]
MSPAQANTMSHHSANVSEPYCVVAPTLSLSSPGTPSSISRSNPKTSTNTHSLHTITFAALETITSTVTTAHCARTIDTAPAPAQHSSRSPQTAAHIGIGLSAGLVFAGLCFTFLLFWRARRRRRHDQPNDTGSSVVELVELDGSRAPKLGNEGEESSTRMVTPALSRDNLRAFNHHTSFLDLTPSEPTLRDSWGVAP